MRVTAERVQRFAEDVVIDPSDETRQRRWRGALQDLRELIHHARAEGCDPEAIHAAAGVKNGGRFTGVGTRT